MIDATFYCDGASNLHGRLVRCDTKVVIGNHTGSALPIGWQAVVRTGSGPLVSHYCPVHHK